MTSLRLTTSIWFVGLAIGGVGCQVDPPKAPTCNPTELSGCIIEEVDVLGNVTVDDASIKERIATAESNHPLGGILQGIPIIGLSDVLGVEYERFDRFVLERDLARVERYYRTRGFYEAHVRAGRVTRRKSDRRVRVEIVVEEGTPVRVKSTSLAWKDWSMAAAADVTKPVTDAKGTLRVGRRLEEDHLERAKEAILRAMTDRGFPYATVSVKANVDLVAHTADVVFTLELGPRSRFGAIRFVGLDTLPEKPIRASLGFKEGDPFSTRSLSSAERVLVDYGVFGAIDVRPELSAPDKPRSDIIPVTITVQRSTLRAIKLGAGAEAGGQVEAHVTASWENRNFLGGMRRFLVEARPGVVFYPNTLNTLFAAAPEQYLPELRVHTELRQPGVFEPRTNVIWSAAGNLYRPQSTLTTTTQTTNAASVPVLGYVEAATALGIERRFVDFQHYLGEFFHIQYDYPFVYPLWERDQASDYLPLLFTYLETVGNLDFRQNNRGEIDRIAPRKGVYFGLNAQIAGYFLPGDVNDIRLRPDFRAYIPIARRVTLAFHLSNGFLIPGSTVKEDEISYEDALAAVAPLAADKRIVDQNGDGIVDGTDGISLRQLRRSLQKLQFRGFYSGGPNSNRGYIYNGVGLQANVPLRDQSSSVEAPWTPTGGLTLWETSLELRFSFTRNLGAILFLDASDLRSGIADFALNRPHLSAGLGLRYSTPVGPVRLDVGYRVPCAQEIGVCDEEELGRDVGLFGTTAGLPLVTTIAIGENF